MGYERYPRGNDPRRDDDAQPRRAPEGYPRDRGSMADFRDYDASGQSGDRYTGQGDRDFYSQREYGNQRYEQRDRQDGDRTPGARSYGRVNHDGQGAGYSGTYQAREEQRDIDRGYNLPPEYRDRSGATGNVGGYRTEGGGGRRDAGRDRPARLPQGRDQDDRGFFQRAGDEVRSWFGDDEAEHRRDLDAQHDGRAYGGFRQHHDSDYHSWRSGQISALDRDYDEYRRENSTRFESEFATWRTARQGQRDALSRVAEHMDVVGSDGEHVGTVDKVRDDRILLTKNDADAGGRHHSIPSRWIETVDAKGVTLGKTAAQAKQQWQDEQSSQALFGDKPDASEPPQPADKTAPTS